MCDNGAFTNLSEDLLDGSYAIVSSTRIKKAIAKVGSVLCSGTLRLTMSSAEMWMRNLLDTDKNITLAHCRDALTSAMLLALQIRPLQVN